jgi:transposase InsO family protein
LLKLGFEVAESTVSKYMIRRRGPPSQTRTFLRNAYVERLIGTLRRECLDHVLIYSEPDLRRILALYSSYYNQTRTHLALRKDAPLRRAVQGSGSIIATPILFGLHHRYARI